MVKTRISVKLNDYEYSALYRVQTNCILAGLNYNRAPPLNEIIRGIIFFVNFDIKNRNENADMFFNTIQKDSEYPLSFYQGPIKTPGNAGNYIFIADDEDTAILKEIGEITSRAKQENYDFPKIIRYCIHYIFYSDGFLYTRYGTITKKAEFVLITVIGNLYGLRPKISTEIFKDPLIGIAKLKSDDLLKIRKIPFDKEVYLSATKMFVREIGLAESKFNWPADILKELDPKSYGKYDSKISDFNFLSVIIGLGYITHMYEIDSFDWTMVSFLLWQNEKIKIEANNTNLPKFPKILMPLGPSIRSFIRLFNELLRQSEKYLNR